MLRSAIATFSVALSLMGCARGGHDGTDAGRRPTLVDGGTSSANDAGSSTTPDASAAPGTDAGMSSPTDAGGALPDAFTPMTGSDAGPAPRPDAGPPPGPDAGPPGPPCTPVPTTGSLVINGTSAGAATWARPNATFCPATGTASFASSVPHVAHVFCNPGAEGTFDFTLEGIGLGDAYLVLYDGGGIPADPLQCFDADDDGYGLGDSEIVGVTVPTGISFTLVATGYDNSDSGSYRLTIWRN